ncbi:hypothetical protein SK128_025271 [Halocaridina rubra]|uniref:Fibronectin type-III domain-containing protein n=1 Tax=Halocaridina rubra TaxID=373956 RepID=A0AAN8WMX9_HALRR
MELETLEIIISDIKPHSLLHSCVGVGNIIDEGACCSVITGQEVPGPPENLNVTDIEATLANITWELPIELNGVLVSWELSWLTDEENETGLEILEPEMMSYQLVDLLPRTVYTVILQASTTAGLGPAANTSFITSRVHEDTHPNVGAIVGGIIGGFLALLFIAGIAFYIVKISNGEPPKFHISTKKLHSFRSKFTTPRHQNDNNYNTVISGSTSALGVNNDSNTRGLENLRHQDSSDVYNDAFTYDESSHNEEEISDRRSNSPDFMSEHHLQDILEANSTSGVVSERKDISPTKIETNINPRNPGTLKYRAPPPPSQNKQRSSYLHGEHAAGSKSSEVLELYNISSSEELV